MSDAGPLLGAHMSIAGGLPRALERGQAAGCTAVQIFVKNNNRWRGRSLEDEEVEDFRQTWRRSSIRSVVAHGCYLINLASPDPRLWERSVAAMLDELDRCRRLGLDCLVAHPGAHVGSGEGRGIRRIARALDRIHRHTAGWGVRVALETTAGQGTSLGCRFEHFCDILDACRRPERVALCLDSCHLFAAGYDIRNEEGYRSCLEQLDHQVGLDKVKVFHLNDSKRELGSRVDRHQHIGRGEIGERGFACIMNDRRLDAVPKILETPKGKTHREDRRNLRLLRSLVRA